MAERILKGKILFNAPAQNRKDSWGHKFSLAAHDLRDWIGNRAESGRLPQKGFPKNNRFG
jgi:topoisomerase IV subunit A